MERHDAARGREQRDPLAVPLEIGLLGLIALAPLPFGAVQAWSRAALEGGALLLLALWLVRGLHRRTALPPRAAVVGLVGLLGLALLQALPMGPGVVGLLSPRALEVRGWIVPTGEALEAERQLLGIEPSSLDLAPSLSLSPERTASALRTGAALAALFLVATTVATERGARRLAWALLLSAAFQGLYGTIVLASGHDRIWGVPKVDYLDSATGTFVNKNHYAAYLVVALALGLGLVLSLWPRASEGSDRRARFVALLGREGSPALFAGFLLLLGLGGLLVSFSRAGIAIGSLSLVAVLLATGRGRFRRRAAVALLLLALGALPLIEIGADRLTERYARAGEDLMTTGGRLDVWRDTVRAGVAFPFVGAGFGAFAEVYPLFRSPGVRLRYDHAHQELLQVAAEGGLLGITLLALLLAPVLLLALRELGAGDDPLAAGLAAGLLGVLIHALVDFPFRVPAIAATAAVAAGALLGSRWNRAR